VAQWHTESRALFGFVGAFAVVALAFVLSSVGTFLASRDVDTAAQDLLGNALPSVEELMRARTAQHRLDVDVDVLTRTSAARPALIDELVAARAELDTTLGRAMDTPDYPGEHELFERRVQPRLAGLDRAIAELQTALADDPGHDRIVRAVSGLDAAAKELDGSLATLAELNHAHAFDAAWRIVNTRAQTVRLALYLESASAAIAIAAAVFAVRGERRYARTMRRMVELEAQRATELDLVAQRISHDLTSPLAAVTLSLGRIRRAHPESETGRAADRASRALERTRHMVDGIYAFSKSGAQPVPGASAPLRAAIGEAADALLAAEGASAPTIDVEPFDEVAVAMDRGLLDTVVSNLLWNAAKFSRGSPVRRITVRSSADERRVHVEVEDTGPGVPSGLEQAIFEPYHRAPGVTQPGLGLGLATVKRLVTAHGGRVGVRNVQPHGALFWFDLPRAAEDSVRFSAARALPSPS